MPSMPEKSCALMASTTACVLLPPMPSRMGRRLAFAFNIVLITRFFSAGVRVGASEVVPRTTKKSAPWSMTWLTMRVNASTSTEKSFLKGVTKATPVPLKGLFFIALLLSLIFSVFRVPDFITFVSPSRLSSNCKGHGCLKQGRRRGCLKSAGRRFPDGRCC